ncbi:MAG TPA: endonuclease/exonuclease/phosphatase family protein [Bacteroidales bacterium]|nr:endonuclease/exonuclease/phosphatase family protein [Bacteroidales bacterium]
MMKKTRFLFLLLIAVPGCRSAGQPDGNVEQRSSFTIFSWNVENLFDTQNDSLTNDDEFTPDGLRSWDRYRYYLKTRAIWKTILSLDADGPPEIITLCEIENEKVLQDIFKKSPFGKYGYQIVHRDSPDPRGIDVALLYDTSVFTLVDTAFIQPLFDMTGSHPTRDILYARLTAANDTLHIFVNHWPSKYGGAGFTEPFRRRAAETLRNLTDSILSASPDSYVICVGDFNDIPESTAIQMLVSGTGPRGTKGHSPLVRLPLQKTNTEGTIRFQGQWQTIDYFFLSEAFFEGHGFFAVDSSGARIYSPGFLLEPDETYGGHKPFRTFTGMRYNGGVSDHLPVMLKIYLRGD